jgi:hypothetical protein
VLGAPSWLFAVDGSYVLSTGDAVILYGVNDDRVSRDEDREESIKRIFARHGVEVSFK